MSYLRSSSLLQGVLVALAVAGSSLAQDANEQVVVARATSGRINPAMTALVARTFRSRALPDYLADEASQRTPAEVIVSLCGYVDDAYFAEFERQNGGIARSRDVALGEAAHTLVWPACLRVVTIEVTRDSARTPVTQESADARSALFSEVARSRNFLSFFPGIRATMTQVISPPVELIPVEGTAAAAAADLIASPDADSVATVVAQPLRGSIVEAADRSIVDPNSPQVLACPTTARPFDPEAVRGAFVWSAGRGVEVAAEPGSASVYIVDNGFFGADPTRTEMFSEAFPSSYFPGWRNRTGRVGPITTFGPSPTYPINYQNGYLVGVVPSAVAAHGTHVVGLTLGGPDFVTMRDSVFRRLDGSIPIALTVINIGAGQRELLPDSDKYVASLINETPNGRSSQGDRRIINLSVAYDGDHARGFFDGLFATAPRSLFVVAAGNKSAEVGSGEIYPAALGGSTSPNVITVAAHDGGAPANLSWFTNWGPTAVDIAAPGCGLVSWFDQTHTAPLSGTSQATPIVTFASAMLGALDQSLEPLQIKQRLLVSGDLLDPSRRDHVVSGSSLNIPHALLLFDDVVTVGENDQSSETWLGDIESAGGWRCQSDTADTARGLGTLWSFKRQGRDQVLFYDRNSRRVSRCAVAASTQGTDARIKFRRRARIINGTIVPEPSPQRPEIIEAGRIREFIRRGPYNGQN